jgi:hypothetical protein
MGYITDLILFNLLPTHCALILAPSMICHYFWVMAAPVSYSALLESN